MSSNEVGQTWGLDQRPLYFRSPIYLFLSLCTFLLPLVLILWLSRVAAVVLMIASAKLRMFQLQECS